VQLVLTVQNLPTMSSVGNDATGGGYQCVFTGHGTTLHTPVMRIDRVDAANTTLRCETPPAKRLPLFPADKGTLCSSFVLFLIFLPFFFPAMWSALPAVLDAAGCYRCSVIFVSVCVLVTLVNPAKTDDPIEISACLTLKEPYIGAT